MVNKFNPDWVSPPGDTIETFLEEKGWTTADLASKLNCSEDYVRLLIAGDVPIFEEEATKLSDILGGSVQFWLKREADYRKSIK